MKRIWILVAVFMAVFEIGCHDVTVGYLLTEDAGYTIDTMIIKTTASLDASPGVLNPEVEQRVLDMGFTLEQLIYDFGMTFEDIAKNFNIPARIGAGEDFNRVDLNLPWVSNPIEGIEGTAVVYVTIKNVKTVDGDADKMLQHLSVYGDGVFEIPIEHTIPVGTYIISLNVQNEGYSKDVDDCFTIIVK